MRARGGGGRGGKGTLEVNRVLQMLRLTDVRDTVERLVWGEVATTWSGMIDCQEGEEETHTHTRRERERERAVEGGPRRK